MIICIGHEIRLRIAHQIRLLLLHIRCSFCVYMVCAGENGENEEDVWERYEGTNKHCFRSCSESFQPKKVLLNVDTHRVFGSK